MNLSAHGDSTSAVEVTNISSHGLWILVRGREYFLPYADFPWFKDQPLKAILQVEEPTRDHYYWPAIDVDLTTEMIEFPERFPKIATK